MKNLKDLGIFLFPYLIICSSIYHLTYWDTFNINGLTIISLEDIIKTSVYPLFLNLFVPIFSAAGALVFLISSGRKEENVVQRKIPNWALISIFLIWLGSIYTMYKDNQWGSLPFFVSLFPALFLLDLDLKYFKEMKSTYVFYIYFIIFMLPVCFYASAKIESEKIKNNIAFKYLINKNSDNQRNSIYKYLGETNDRFIVSDLSNENIIYIKSDQDTIKFRFHTNDRK